MYVHVYWIVPLLQKVSPSDKRMPQSQTNSRHRKEETQNNNS